MTPSWPLVFLAAALAMQLGIAIGILVMAAFVSASRRPTPRWPKDERL